jgi:hypothetical protein
MLNFSRVARRKLNILTPQPVPLLAIYKMANSPKEMGDLKSGIPGQ